MNRAERRARDAAEAASEAGRVLQAAGQAKSEAGTEPAGEADAPAVHQPKLDNTRELALEGLYQGRKKAAETDPKGELPPGLPPEEGKEPTDEEREAGAVRKAEKAREEAALKAQKAAEKKPDAAVQQEIPLEPAAEVVAPTTSKQKVDGVEYDVPLSEIEEAGGEKSWRLNKANENRLAKTNEALAQTRTTQAQLAAWLEAQKPKVQKPTTEQLIAKLAANRFSTDEEFAAGLKEVLAEATPHIDQNAIILQATVNMKRDLANAQYVKDNNDIFSNPVLKKVADQMEMESLKPYIQQTATGPQANWAELGQLDWSNFYSTIANQVRSVIGPRQSQPSSTPAKAAEGASGNPSQLSEKEARKASIVNLPQAAAARAVAPAEEKPETREESLNRMRKSRGIPTG